MNELLFPGQQEDERVLHEAVPHGLCRIMRLLQVLVVAAGFGLALYFLSQRFNLTDYPLAQRGYYIIAGLAVLFMWLLDLNAKGARTYITDRRIVRFEPFWGLFRRRRALFWKEVAKSKAFAPNLLFRLFKVGTVEVRPSFANDEDIKVPGVYYFEDLANYLDKILHLQKNKPEDLGSLRPFVAKPKGQRYRQE